MRKRKPPYVAIAIVIILLGVIAVVNSSGRRSLEDGHNHAAGTDHGHDHAHDNPPASTEDQKAEMKAHVKSIVGNSKTTETTETTTVSKRPVVVKQETKAEAYRPKPNDNAVSGGWYREESYVKNK